MKKTVLVVCVCLATILSAAVCKRCRGAKTIEQKTECPVCNGLGYRDSLGRIVMCQRCSKGGLSTTTTRIEGKNYKIGPGVLKEQVACPDCDGTGRVVEKQDVPERPVAKPEAQDDGIVTIRMKRSSVKKLLEDGEIKGKKYHFVIVED